MYVQIYTNFGSFLFKFEIYIRKTIRLIESTDKKLINAELALLFNETCKNENILPRCTDIYIYTCAQFSSNGFSSKVFRSIYFVQFC